MKSHPQSLYKAEYILADLKKQLVPHIYDGVELSSVEVYALICELDAAIEDVRSMAKDLSRKRWKCDEERQETSKGNVVLFPATSRLVSIGKPKSGDRS